MDNLYYQPAQILKICSKWTSGSCNRYIWASRWPPNLIQSSSILIWVHTHVPEALFGGIMPHIPRNRYHPPTKNLKAGRRQFLGTMLVYFRSTSPNSTKRPHQHHLSYQRKRSIWLDHGLESLSARNSEILLPRASELIFGHATWPFSPQPTNSVQTTAPTFTHGANTTNDLA